MAEDAPKDRSNEGRKPLREDPLSLVLIGAAVLLTIVYVWDKQSRETLQEQMAIAESIHANFRVDTGRCTVGSADADGQMLVFACTGIDAQDVARAAAQSRAVDDSVGAFEQVLFQTPDDAFVCPSQPDGWPDTCGPYVAEAQSKDDTSHDDHDH